MFEGDGLELGYDVKMMNSMRKLKYSSMMMLSVWMWNDLSFVFFLWYVLWYVLIFLLLRLLGCFVFWWRISSCLVGYVLLYVV